MVFFNRDVSFLLGHVFYIVGIAYSPIAGDMLPCVWQKYDNVWGCGRNMTMSSILIYYINIDSGDVATEGDEEMILMGEKKSKW